jgi:hypothetical protein
MAGFTKRGGARGGSTYKKTFTKKRSSPDADTDDNAPRASKKTKSGDDEDDEALPVVPELKTDDNGDAYIGVSTEKQRKYERRHLRVLTIPLS